MWIITNLKLSFPYKSILLLIILSFGHKAVAQPYEFEIDQREFTYLKDSISINNGELWGGIKSFNIPFDFPFEFMDTTFNQVILESTGRLVFDSDHFYFIDMLSSLGLSDKGQSISESPLSYTIDGNIGSRILKIEFRNATHIDDNGATINFQIWLYENEGRIELVVGPNDVRASINFQSGIYKLNSFIPTDYAYGLVLSGSPAMPTISILNGAATGNNFLERIPDEQTLYVFSKEVISSNTRINSAKQILLFPNPAIEYITIDLLENNIALKELKVLSNRGQVLMIKENVALPYKLNIEHLSESVYALQLVDVEEKRYVQYFIKAN